MKLFIRNNRSLPFSTDLLTKFGHQIRVLVPPGEEAEIVNVDPFWVNRDKNFRNEIFRDGDLNWRWECEPDDLICFSGYANFGDTRPADKGAILVGDGTRWQKYGPGPDGTVPEWDSTQPLGIKPGSGAAAGTKAMLTFIADRVGSSDTGRYLSPGIEDGLALTLNHPLPMPIAGTLRNMYVRHTVPAGNGNPVRYRLQVNGSDTALVVNLASTATLGFDTTNTVVVAATDLVNLVITKPSGGIGTSPRRVVVTIEVG